MKINILCSEEKCGGVIARLSGRNLLEIVRGKNKEQVHTVKVVGKDFQALVSCPRCFSLTNVAVENGNLITSENNINQEENEEQPKTEEQPSS